MRLSSEDLGALPKSLSLSIYTTHDVFGGALVPLDSIPETIAWKDGWRLATEHSDISTNVSGDLCRTLGRALEAAREIFLREIGRSAEDLERAFLAWARSTGASPEATTAQRSAQR